ACSFPALFDALADADRAAGAEGRISDRLYPVPRFTAEERQRDEEALCATGVAQPALGAVSLGAWRLLQSFGVQADAAAGHSFGELTALCYAGRLTGAEFHALARLRGRLMAEAGGPGDAGAMLAALAPRAAVAEVLRDEGLGLVPANHNGPAQTVLSGLTS